MNKKAVVIFSGGMDSSICLKVAIKKWGADQVLAMTFNYGQRHSPEIEASQKITQDWNVEQTIIPITFLKEITKNSLTHHDLKIGFDENTPNSLVSGRNGLMTRIASIHADHLGADEVYTGVIEVEEANSGYRDCNRSYFDKLQEILRIDFNNENFSILTPVVKMTKFETMKLAKELGVLEYLLENTITCYEGIPKYGCGRCPSCKLRNQAVEKYIQDHSLNISYISNFSK